MNDSEKRGVHKIVKSREKREEIEARGRGLCNMFLVFVSECMCSWGVSLFVRPVTPSLPFFP
jgi:hypothetical protein